MNKPEDTTAQKPLPQEVKKLHFEKDTTWSWIACFCAFQTCVLITGILHGFGGFFVAFTHEFNATKGESAWVGSLAYGTSMFTGPVASMLTNRFEQRFVMMVGAALCAVANLTSSFVTSFSFLYLSFSLVFGLGASLAVTCTVTVSQQYFDKYTTITMGVISSGSSFGTLVMAPLSQFLIDTVGWRNSFRVFAGTCGFCTLCNAFLIPIVRPKIIVLDQVRTSPLRKLMEDLKLWKNRVFVVWTCAITCVMFGYYIPYVHMVSYAADCGIKPEKASFLIMILGISTAFGRIIFGKIIQYGLLDRVRMHQLSMVITGAGTMFLPLIRSFAGIATYIVIVGLVDGCYIVLLPLLTCSLMGSEKMVLAWGFLIGTASFTFTMGPPVAGFLYDATGSYNLAFHIAGIPILSGAIIMFLIPWAQRTSATNNRLQNLEEPRFERQEEIVDFITLSRVPSLLSAKISKTTLSGSRKDNDSIPPESVSLLDADWGAYFVNNLNQVTFVPGSMINRPGMREVDFDLQALERNDEVLSDMLRQSAISPQSPIRISGPAATALLIGSSPIRQAYSMQNHFRRSDVINISSSTPRRYPRPFRAEDVEEPGGCSNDAACQTDLSFSINAATSIKFERSMPSSSISAYSPTKGFSSAKSAFPTRSLSPVRDVPNEMSEHEQHQTSSISSTIVTSSNESDIRYSDRLITYDTIPEDVDKSKVAESADVKAAPLRPEPSSSPPVTNKEIKSTDHPAEDSPQFYTSHNRRDYTITPNKVTSETQPVDIPTPDVNVTGQFSDFDVFEMELPPSPPNANEHIPMALPSLKHSGSRTPVPTRVSKEVVQHVDSDSTSQSSTSASSTQPPPQKVPATKSMSAGKIATDKAIPDTDKRRSKSKTSLLTSEDERVKTPDPPAKTSSATDHSDAVFEMDPLSPPPDENYTSDTSSEQPRDGSQGQNQDGHT